jgi:hypothetical protein
MNWLSLFRRARAPRPRSSQTLRQRHALKPSFEMLEDRAVPAVFNVNSTLDTLAPPPGVTTLRSAIQQANQTPGGNTINITVPGDFRITLPGAGTGTNNSGAFAILPSGGDLNITNTSGGKVVIDGGNLDRVFDINPGFDAANPTPKFLVTIQGVTITGGRAFDPTGANVDGGAASGGGIRAQGNASLTLLNDIVTDNSATADGGGIVSENTVSVPWTFTITNTVISNNRAGDAGGGIDVDGSGKLFVNNSTITGNSSTNQGAGIWLDAVQVGTVFQTATLTVTGSLVSGNMAIAAGNVGGGIGNAGNGIVTIQSSTISDNFSGGVGGGFGDENAQGTLVVVNSTFVNNDAIGNGGGIEASGPTTTINDSTITGNLGQADGGGINVASAAFTLNNTIVALNLDNNNAGAGNMNFQGPAPDIFAAVTTGNGNFIGIGDANLTGITNGTNGNQIGTVAMPLDPLLGPLQNNGGQTPTRAPLPGSPVIDAGINAVVPTGTVTDQRGALRIVNARVDVGAVEFQSPATSTTLTLSAGSVVFGHSITLTAKVAPTSAAPNNVPTGTVTFFSGTTSLGTATLDGTGTATLTLSNEPAGLLSLTATYSGDALFTTSTSAATQLNVFSPATTTALTVTPPTVAFGHPVTLTAVVAMTPGAPGVPTGTVTFFSGTQALGTATLDATGTARLTISNEPPGLLSITAQYSGDTVFTASTSGATLLRVFTPETIGAYDSTTGTWYLANHTSSGAPDAGQFQYGGIGWFGLVGNWTGSGQETIAVVDPTTETWYIRFSNTPGAPDLKFQFGAPGWIPIAGDWTGTGHFGIGVFDPNTGTFYLRKEVSAGGADAGVFKFGAPHWIPVTGDWSGSGKTGIGVVDPTTETWYLRNSASAGGVDFTPFQFGAPGWKPVTGDWNGDGKTTIGVLDPSGKWYLRNSNTPGGVDFTPFAYGLGTWTPVAGNWQVPSAHALHAVDQGPGAASLDPADLQATVQAALTRLSEAGVSAELAQRLGSAHYQLAALPTGTLGLTFSDSNEVLISEDAAGHGWFVDHTPLQDEEFGANGSALPGSPAVGREDLLTTVLHEMGHLAGLPDDSGSLLLADSLATGVRHTDHLDAVFAAGA